LDILGDPQTFNPYVYVRNNPVNYIDPSGFYAIEVPLTFFRNYPGTKTPNRKSNVGNGWIGVVDIDGNGFIQGARPGRGQNMRYDQDLFAKKLSAQPRYERLKLHASS
jgi:hypothetical protein